MNKVFFVLFLLPIRLIGYGACFLMNTTHEAGTLYGYQNLVGLIMDEKMVRHQLEDRLNHMEQSYLEITKELQKDRNNRQQLIDENSRLNLKVMNLTSGRIKLESNLEKLFSDYNILKVDFDNLTVAHRKLNEDTSHWKSMQETLEKNVNNLTKEQELLSNKYHVLLEQYLSVTSHNQNTFVNKSSLAAEMDKLLHQLHDMKSNLSSLIINNRRQISENGIQQGFSLQNVNKSSTSSLLKFTTVRFNIGNMFNMSSGEFVCKRAGLYFFTITIVREPGITQSYCSIVVNNSGLQTTVGYGSSTTGYSSGSAVLVYHLTLGDRVFVGYCHGIDHIYWTSSFSGFLIVPDQ